MKSASVHFVSAMRWALALAMVLTAIGAAVAQPPEGYSVHAEQSNLVPAEDSTAGAGVAKPAAPQFETNAVTPPVGSDFIVFGYSQSDSYANQYHYQALTHVATEFVSFTSSASLTGTGNFTSRSVELRSGGAAERHGVKVILTINNSGFDPDVLDAVFQSPTLRSTLITNIVSLLNADPYVHGVTLDFEPITSSNPIATMNGIGTFIADLKAALPSGKDELSMYLGPTYYGTNYAPILAQIASIDFINYSCYPWVGSFSVGSPIYGVSPQSFYDGQVDSFLNAGVPASKIVLIQSSYGQSFSSATGAYASTALDYLGSSGFADEKFNTTLSANLRTRQYNNGHENPYYSFDSGTTDTVVVYDDEQSIAAKIRASKSWIGAAGTGQRLRGVGFWSLGWMTNNFIGGANGYDLEALASNSTISRTYPHIYQAVSEGLKTPGTRSFLLDKFENLDPSWTIGTNTNSRKDNANVNTGSSSLASATAPAGAGKPSNSDRCAAVAFNFTAGSGKLFARYIIWGDEAETSIKDLNATRGFFPISSTVSVDIHTPAAYSGHTIRMILLDGNGQLEQSQAFSLNASGWRTLTWNLASDPVSAYNTNFNQYADGDGTINTAGNGARDLSIIGFMITNSASSSSGTVNIDELRWSPTAPSGNQYLVNEFRYPGNNKEYVEIYGPAGAVPSTLQLRVMSGGSYTPDTYSLSGVTIPNNLSGGMGVIAVGDSGISGVTSLASFSTSVDDLTDGSAAAGIQLYDTATGYVHDSVAYQMGAGASTLGNPGNAGVVDNGYPWIGACGSGTSNAAASPASEPYAFGRYPDGANTWVNFSDFTFMPASPTAANGNTVTIGTTLNFSTVPAKAFSTFQSFNVTSPASGPGNSPSGGNAHRCVDTGGGGNMSVIGDAALGSAGNGYRVTGELFIPGSSDPVQTIGIAICGGQGVNFFSDTVSATSGTYETGYWLLYQNAAGAGIDAITDFPGTFKVLYAANTRQTSTVATELASVTPASLGITPGTAGTWTTFEMYVNPNLPSGQLTIKLNGNTVTSQNLPAGGPTKGPFVCGFRENHTGAPVAKEGTWVDNLSFTNAPAADVQDWKHQ